MKIEPVLDLILFFQKTVHIPVASSALSFTRCSPEIVVQGQTLKTPSQRKLLNPRVQRESDTAIASVHYHHLVVIPPPEQKKH